LPFYPFLIASLILANQPPLVADEAPEGNPGNAVVFFCGEIGMLVVSPSSVMVAGTASAGIAPGDSVAATSAVAA
jgi:hypothetical protein